MKKPAEWLTELAAAPPDPAVEILPGRDGTPTMKVNGVMMHSRYQPIEEARRLIDSAELDPQRPVVVIGAGLGYHVIELLERGFRVAVIEPLRAVAKAAVEGPLRGRDVLLGIGDPENVCASLVFRLFTEALPQVFLHPPTGHVHPEYCAAATARVAATALSSHRLRIAVIGPMYGGSLPIAGYLERAFASLGHVTSLIDNSCAWDVFNAATTGVKAPQARQQLGSLLAHFLGEWNYARAAEFAPDICIVIAQAPVAPKFPIRLAQEGIVTAFWFVENWRHLGYWKDIAPHYDYFFHIQPGEFERRLDESGCRHHAYVQTACDPAIHKPVALSEEERGQYGCDMSFAGAGYANRLQLFKGLTDYDFKIWGVNWNARELQALVCNPDERFTPEIFAKIVAGSKINLNLHSSTTAEGVDPKCDAINPRVFEIAACGGFQLCDPCIGLDTLFAFETELPVYRDLNEARAKIDHFLRRPDERAAIAGRARDRVLREHTYKHRAQQMLDLILEAHGARILKKGIRVQRTVAEIIEKAGRDSELGKFLRTLAPDLMFTHENINAAVAQNAVAQRGQSLSHPQLVFHYLREVRTFAETLLALKP